MYIYCMSTFKKYCMEFYLALRTFAALTAFCDNSWLSISLCFR